MAVSTGLALAAGLGTSALGQLIGGNKKSTSSTSAPTGFNALPKAVQDAWLNVALPKILATADRPYQPIPTQRVNAPNSIFDSQGLYDLQKYSDSIGGLFSPIAGQRPNVQQQAPAAQNTQPFNQDSFASLVKTINPTFGMTVNGQFPGAGIGVQNQEAQRLAIQKAFQNYIGGK